MYSFTKKEFSALCYSLPHALPNGGGRGEVRYIREAKTFSSEIQKEMGEPFRELTLHF